MVGKADSSCTRGFNPYGRFTLRCLERNYPVENHSSGHMPTSLVISDARTEWAELRGHSPVGSRSNVRHESFVHRSENGSPNHLPTLVETDPSHCDEQPRQEECDLSRKAECCQAPWLVSEHRKQFKRLCWRRQRTEDVHAADEEPEQTDGVEADEFRDRRIRSDPVTRQPRRRNQEFSSRKRRRTTCVAACTRPSRLPRCESRQARPRAVMSFPPPIDEIRQARVEQRCTASGVEDEPANVHLGAAGAGTFRRTGERRAGCAGVLPRPRVAPTGHTALRSRTTTSGGGAADRTRKWRY